MPEIKIKHVLSFSSEDPPHKAENLLSGDATRKWKCAPGEKQASIIFQLEKSTELSSIDIGNEGSAFVEILVGRSSNNNVKYQVILVASSFMSPQESRQGASPNRVRIFDKDKLAPDVVSQKWDLIKIVCTQPFNKRISYGLSFVKFHTLSGDIKDIKTEVESSSNRKVKEEKKTFGGFKLKDEATSDPSSNILNPGVQMKMYQIAKKEKPNDRKADGHTAGTKEQGIQKESKRRSRSPETKKTEEKRRKVDKSATPARSAPVKFDTLKQKAQKQKATITQTAKTSSAQAESRTKPTSIPKKKSKKPFDQILDGVIFVISGFQHPLRGEIREKALRMGAQYRKDWTNDSTHLVCAFPNTPKYRQVIGLGGKIVRKDWIEDCASRKRMVSWKKYSMNPDQSSGSSSEEDEVEERESAVIQKENLQDSEEDDQYGGSTDEGGDTEDEIEKIQAQNTKSDNKTKQVDDDAYDASTDEEAQPDENGDDALPVLPDYFDEKQFLLYGDFPVEVRKQLRRHVIACGGKISDYMNDDIDYVVTLQPWDDNFEQALASNAGLVFVKPGWVFQCGYQQKIVPHQPYVVAHS